MDIIGGRLKLESESFVSGEPSSAGGGRRAQAVRGSLTLQPHLPSRLINDVID
jgi:hypothetical protein